MPARMTQSGRPACRRQGTKIQKYKKTDNIGLFDQQEICQKLSFIGNPLEMISKVIDFEIFRKSIEAKLLNQNKKNNAGAKPYDVVMMFKIMTLGAGVEGLTRSYLGKQTRSGSVLFLLAIQYPGISQPPWFLPWIQQQIRFLR